MNSLTSKKENTLDVSLETTSHHQQLIRPKKEWRRKVFSPSQTVTLREGLISIQDCESIHQHLPAIETFQLKNVVLILDELPDDIAPAASVTSFGLSTELIYRIERYPNWYRYLAQKYMYLETFYCDDIMLPRANYGQMMSIYQERLLPNYRRLGQRLSSIIARNVPVELHLFNQLSEFGCQIQSCRLVVCEDSPVLIQLRNSQLAANIQELEIEDTVVDFPNQFSHLANLTMLSLLDSLGDFIMEINFVELSNGLPPLLVELSIACRDLQIIRPFDTLANNIRVLNINCDVLTKNLFRIISSCFLNLKSLSLQGAPVDKFKLDSPGMELDYLHISLSFNHQVLHDEFPAFSVRSVVDSVIDHYCGRMADNTTVTLEHSRRKNYQGTPYIRVICASVQTLDLDITLV
jgi:hypothetical protein